MTYSGSYWNGYLDETNFGGGAGGAIYTPTEPANSAALTSQNHPFNEEADVPVKEYNQEALEAAGQGKSEKTTFTNETTVLQGLKHQYVQNYDWIAKAISGTSGAIPTDTWCEVYYDGQRYKAAYGCYMGEYSLTIDKRSWPKEDITYNAWDVLDVATPGNFSTPVDWDKVNAPKIYHDWAVTIDGTALTEFSTATLTVTPEYTEPTAGVELHNFPYMIKHDWTLDFSCYEYLSVLEDLETSTANLFPVVISGWGQTLTLTNMKIQKDSLNIKTMPEKGQKVYSAIVEIGGNSTATLA